MTASNTVLLAGASGVFGRHITRVLSDHGYLVLGVGRGPGNTVRADLNDRDQLLRAVDGRQADVVIHAATALAKPPIFHRDMIATDKLRTVGMRNLIEAARTVGASRFVTESMVFGYGWADHGSVPLTEDAPWAPHVRDRRVAAHLDAFRTKEELTFGTPGLDGVSLRFGLFYGPGGTEPIVASLRKRMLPAPATKGMVLPWVHLDDAADAVLAAIERGRPGAAYNIADDAPMSFGDQIRATATAFGTPKPPRLPVWMFRPTANLYAMLHTNVRLNTAKAADELGWRPRYATSAIGLAALVASTGSSTGSSIGSLSGSAHGTAGARPAVTP
jgi:nucleoside-diphosphate-sugar epimerase